jgi:hypothetical protein
VPKEYITSKDILENPEEELDIPGVGTVLVKYPTTKDKIDARIEAMKQPGFDSLSPTERAMEIGRRISLKMLVNPKISEEDYLNSNDSKMSMILDTISMWYATKLKELNDKRAGLMKHFLEQMKESS